jgi:predicted transcriptional regulator
MSARKENIKINENIAVNESKNTTKFNKDNNNFNERTNNTLNQQQDAINKTLENTLNNIKRTTDEATREIPRYTQCIAEYQEKTIQTVKDIASGFIEAEKEVIGSFQSQVDRNSGVNSSSNGLWDLYNPQRIAENHAVMVNNFTSYLLNTSNLINNALVSNMRVYNTALEQTRDNLKACAKTNTNCIQAVKEQSVNSQDKVRWIDMLKFSPNGHYSKRFKELELAIHTLSNNNQSLGISYIANKENHNKKFMLSIIEFLKEIGWLVRDEDGKNIHRYTTNTMKNVRKKWVVH